MTSNTIELFQPEYTPLAVPAAMTLILIDGILCEELAPLEIVRGGWPDFGWARLTYHPAGKTDADDLPRAHVEDRFGMGRTVCLQQLYDRRPQGSPSGITVFAGQIETLETTVDSERASIEIVARDFSAALERITVYGRRVVHDSGPTALVPGLDTTFNPNGHGNASAQPIPVEDKTYTVFTGTANARAWTCADVLDYLLSEYLPLGCLHRPSVEQLQGLTEYQPVRDLDVTGLSLLEALHRCCQGAGLAFRFVPRLLASGPAQALVFYRNGHGRTVELNGQPTGQPLCLSHTNVAALHSQRGFYPVAHRHIGQGDFKVYEATFDLVKAWDPALEGSDVATFSPLTNPQFHQVRDVYRKWCLNEAGDYTAAPYARGAPFEFSAIFAGAAYVQQRRRFWPALTADAQGRSLGYKLEVSRDGGLHWYDYVGGFDNLLDECGVWLGADRLDTETWVAAQRDNLKFRITAAVVSDERLTAIVTEGPIGSTAPVIDHVITLPRQFRYRQVSAQSRFAQAVQSGGSAADQVDDSEALYAFLRRTAAASSHIFEIIEVQTSTLAWHFEPGDRVTSSTDSRDLLDARRDNRSLLWIEHVRMDFVQQCTKLHVARRRA